MYESMVNIREILKRRPMSLFFIVSLVLVAIIISLGGFSESLDHDEGISIASAKRPFAEIPDFVAKTDVHPPLYYMMLSLWLHASDSVEWCRLLSLLLYVGTGIGILLLLSRMEKYGRNTLMMTSLVLCASLSVGVSHLVRMYSLLLFLCTWTLLLFFLHRQIKTRASFFALSLSALLCILTHYYAFTLILSLLAYSFVEKKDLRKGITAAFPLIISCLLFSAIWGPKVMTQIDSSAGGLRYSISPLFLVFGYLQVFGYPVQRTSLVPFLIGLSVGVSYLAYLLSFSKKNLLLDMRNSTCFWILLLQTSTFAVLGLVVPNVFNDKYSIPIIPVLALFFVEMMPLSGPSKKPRLPLSRLASLRRLGPILLIAISLVAIGTASFGNPLMEDWKGAVRYVQSHEEKYDVILFPCAVPYEVFDYYYSGSQPLVGLIPMNVTLSYEEVHQLVSENCEGRSRAWYILYLADHYDPEDFILASLKSLYTSFVLIEFQNVQIALFSQ
jgi:hypothetical protein